MKFHDVDIDDAVIASGGNIIANGSVNLIAQGVTESQRVGRKCTITAIGWRFRIILPEQDAVATPASSDLIRVILYWDKQANGATAVNTDILESSNIFSFNNLANSGRFKTLMDRTYPINYLNLASDGAGVVSHGNVILQDSFYKKCNVPIEFSGATGALTEIRSNNIGVMVVGLNNIAGFTSKMRVRFADG